MLNSLELCRALSLVERSESLSSISRIVASNDLIRRRVRRWRAQAPFTADIYFAQRLAADGLSEAVFHHLLGESIEAVQGRLPIPPAWLAIFAQAYAQTDSSKPSLSSEVQPGQETAGFLSLIEPLIGQGCARLHEGVQAVSRMHPDPPFDPTAIEALLLADLPGQLLGILNRTLVLELHVARLRGLLTGETPNERFRSFVERLRQREVALALFEEYPVLARLLVTAIDRCVDFGLEFLQHLCADWQAVRALFSPDKDPGVLTQVQGGAGDTHRGGRSVLILRFSSGFRVVYKSRSLAVDVHFQELLAWLNAHGDHPPFRTLNVLERGSHGWAEFVPANGCTTPEEVHRFYQRQGGYLAILYALEATDFHLENLIASGEHPMLIDLESLFHPHIEIRGFTGVDRTTLETMVYSVMRVGLLPQRLWANAESEGVDLSGLGATPGQLTLQAVPCWEGVGTDEMRLARKRMEMPGSQNRPTLAGAEINVLDHVESITSGFTAIYQLLLEHRAELLSDGGPLACFADDELRVILRATQTYALLLRESFHPDVLRDALDRDRLFDRLWVDVPHDARLARVIPAERDDLWQRDIPLFTTRARSRDLWSSAGVRISDYFDEPGLTLVRRRVQQLSETDLERQRWFIRAALTTLVMGGEHALWARYSPTEPKTMASRERLLAAAHATADRLDVLALRGDAHADASWIGLMLFGEKHWSLVPLGLDLYDGVPGVALFLAYIGEITGEARYVSLARAALTTMRRQIVRNKSLILSIGGFGGWGGVIYVLTHLATLWNEPALLIEAEALVELLPVLIDRDESLDIISGAAGGIGGLLSLYQCTQSERALDVAVQCGDRLIQRARPQFQDQGWAPKVGSTHLLAGFSHGAAGMAWALLELAAATDEARFRDAALAAIAYERGLFAPEAGNWPDLRECAKVDPANNDGQPKFMSAWCHGAPGIGLARLGSLSYLDNLEIRAEIDVALRTTLAQGFGGNHSLCHGDLGNLELLLQASQVLPDPQWKAQTERIASTILESIHQHGWLCGVPLGVETPGLMTGLAGIGYGLLRLAEPERVPSVLTLEPPKRALKDRSRTDRGAT
jgi:type 2 lantibiotic biosynthesis protein LanM